MKIGKIPNDVLKKLVLDKIIENRKEIVVRPGIGEDCCAIDFGSNLCVISTDPITGTDNNIGKLAVHVSCNDLAAAGAEPIGLLVTILAPPSAEIEELDFVMNDICKTASSINVDVIGGHTEVTNAVNRFVLSFTAIGKIKTDKLITTAGSKANDKIILTKSAGFEGTAILASEKQNELEKHLDKETIKNAKAFINNISVLKEGIIAAEFGVNSMHDVTEGGILGAIWEICEASHVGAVVYSDKVPIEKETKLICDYYGIDPLKLISSGSMLIVCKDGEGLVKILENKNIKATVIGEITESNNRILIDGKNEKSIDKPDSDELYKVINI